MTPLARALADQIRRDGPMSFGAVMDRALYDPEHGFYAGRATAAGTEARAGGSGDFLTSPEVGPLFGAVVARALDRWWDELGRPDPFTVVEAAAGTGTLARTVLAAAPACAGSLRYLLVERSAPARRLQSRHLDVVDGSGLDLATAVAGSPQVAALPDLPGLPDRPDRSDGASGRLTGVVLANELLDNLAVELVERGPEGWRSVEVGVSGDDGQLVERLVEADESVARWAEAHAPAAPVGARLPRAVQAGDWLRRALGVLDRGQVVVLDYTDTTAGMADRSVDEWLRTYRDHQRGTAPLEDLGEQDVTCEVPLDQLAAVATPAEVSTQADFLQAHGLDELVAEGRRIWQERAHVGDLDAIRARSRVGEAEALVDPTGLVSFTVARWVVPA